MSYFCCRRGQENLQKLTKAHFAVGQDATGAKFVFQAIDEATKNHRDDDEGYGGNMYACGGHMCPVYTFELYLRLLNDGNDSLFQRAKIGYQVNDGACMYVNAKAGRDKLALMMSVMSTSAGLSKRYTNHCVRATCVSLLDENYDPTQIMGISMHKSLSSILSYRGRVKRSKKREMSRSLTKACMQQVSDESSNDVSFMAESTSSDVMVMAESTAADVNLMTEPSQVTQISRLTKAALQMRACLVHKWYHLMPLIAIWTTQKWTVSCSPLICIKSQDRAM